MGRERILVREKKLDPDTCPIIVGAIKKTTPRIQHVKSKERIKVKTSRGKLPTNRAKIDEVDEGLTGQLMDSKFWMDNILFSKSTSAEFRLPDISLSGLDDLLETVTQKLKRKKRRGEGPVQSDHLLMAKHRKSCVLEKRTGLLSGLSNV